MSTEGRRASISALVVADDLTGAHASAEALRGPATPLSVVASPTMTREQRDLIAGMADVVVCATGTRNATRDRAVAAVRDALRLWWPAGHVAKRVDSTLRGHVGAEVGALVRELAALSGRRVLALVCPAHPAAGRTTLAGRQHLHGLPLDASAGSRATIEPLDRSHVLPLLRAEGRLRGTGVDLAAVRRGVADQLDAAVADGLDAVVFDAETLDDVDQLATGVAGFVARHPDVLVVSVDPGPFTALLHRYLTAAPGMAPGISAPVPPVLAVVGSASDLTRRQLRRLMDHRPTRLVPVVDAGPSGGRRLRPVGEVVGELTAAADTATPCTVLVLTTVATADEGGGQLDLALSGLVPAMLGEVVRLFLEARPVSGLLLTGGEVAAGVLADLGAVGVRPAVEVEPLAVQGFAVGGPWSGLPLATKGGLVGGDETLVRCVDQLTVRGSPGHTPARPASLT